MEDSRLSIIKDVINDNSLITLSWGICDLEMSKEEIQFKVNGLKFQGNVIIRRLEEETINITLINAKQSYTLKSSIKDMIEILDKIIEYSNNYYEEIIKKCPSPRNEEIIGVWRED